MGGEKRKGRARRKGQELGVLVEVGRRVDKIYTICRRRPEDEGEKDGFRDG